MAEIIKHEFEKINKTSVFTKCEFSYEIIWLNNKCFTHITAHGIKVIGLSKYPIHTYKLVIRIFLFNLMKLYNL